jgi:metal-sulfur cluster biosynthetic enzyme
MTDTAEQTTATPDALATNGAGSATNGTEPATNGAGPAANEAAPATSGAAATAAPLFDAERRATELAILDALRNVVDPEIGMNVVELALIKQILLGDNETEVKMILTTPFCPYAGSMIQQVQEQAESVVEHPVKVTLLAERWDPRDAGLMW